MNDPIYAGYGREEDEFNDAYYEPEDFEDPYPAPVDMRGNDWPTQEEIDK